MPDKTLEVEFWQWVDQLGKWYFCPENEGCQVRLYWPHSEEFEGKENKFVEVVRKYTPNGDIINTSLQLNRLWNPIDGTFPNRYHSLGLIPVKTCAYPPYLPYLVCFSMAWSEEGSYSPHAYYDRLNNMLQLDWYNRIHTQQFKRVDCLWKDLEKWTNDIKGGELGLFYAISAGHMIHIGYPLSQVVLSPSERRKLHHIFSREGLTPEIDLDDKEIADLLSRYLDMFQNRVQSAIEQDKSAFLTALYEEIRLELTSYEPARRQEFRQHHNVSIAGDGGRRYRLRLACLAGLHGIIHWAFMPFQEIMYMEEICQGSFTIRPGQSAGILWQRTAQGDTADPMQFDNLSFLKQELRIDEGGTHFLWPDRNVRFFVPSNRGDGLLLEQDFLPETGLVNVLVSDDDKNHVAQIAQHEFGDNIPDGCKLFRVNDIAALNKLYSERRLRGRYTNPISLTGGIRLSPWEDSYFPYALPQVLAAPGWTLKVGTPSVWLEALKGSEFRAIRITVEKFSEEIEIHAFKNKRRKTKRIAVSLCPDINTSSIEGDTFDIHSEMGEETALVQGDWQYPTWPADLEGQNLGFWENPTLQTWEVLSTWGHCSYRKFNDTVLELFGEQSPRPYQVARDLQFLGHIDIGCSPSNGQWNRVRMSKGGLCCLPWKMGMLEGEFAQAILVGQVHWGRLLAVLKDLPDEVEFDTREQQVPWVPPCIRFWAADKEALVKLAERLDVQWQDWTIQHKMPSIKDFLSSIESGNWVDGLLSPGESVTFFSPYHLKDYQCNEYRVGRLIKITQKYLLATQEQTYGLSEFYLLDTSEKRRLRLSAGQRQWGRWLSYTRTAQEFYKKLFRSRKELNREVTIAIPYDPTKGLLAFPKALIPPMSVARLLCRCSGLLPLSVKWGELSATIEGLDIEGKDKYDSPFFFPAKGSAFVYRNIPDPVASAIGSKLGVKIKNMEFEYMEEVR